MVLDLDVWKQFEIMEKSVIYNTFGFEDVIHNKMMEFVDYYRRTWIEGWPIEVWSVALLYISTDNTSEIYHSYLNRKVHENHPTVEKLLFHLMDVEERAIWHIQQIDAGNIVNNNHNNKWKKRIIKLTNDYYVGAVLIDGFFNGLDSISRERNSIIHFDDANEEYNDGTSILSSKINGNIKFIRKRRSLTKIVDERGNSKFIKKFSDERLKRLKMKKKERLEIVQKAKKLMKSRKAASLKKR